MWLIPFSILQIRKDGRAYLVEYDNPGCVMIRDGQVVPIPYNVREIEGKLVRECRLTVELGDCFVLFSDGVIHAGLEK